MAIPTNPTDGQAYTNSTGISYRYDSTKTAWLLSGSSVARSMTWSIATPATGGVFGSKLYETFNAIKISSYSDATVGFNIQDRTSTPGIAGLTLLATDQTALPAGTDGLTLQNTVCPANSWLYLDIKGTSGTPTKLVVTIAGTV